MTKELFLAELEKRLKGLTAEEIEEALTYYREYIEEGAAAGHSEEEVVASLDPPDVIASQIKADSAFAKAAEHPTPRNTSRALAAVFGVLSLPITLPLALSLIAVAIAVLITAFAVFVSLFCAIIAVIAGMIVLGVRSVILLAGGFVAGGEAVFTVGLALIGLGLAVFTVILLCLFGKWTAKVVGRFFRWLGNCVKRIREKAAAKKKNAEV